MADQVVTFKDKRVRKFLNDMARNTGKIKDRDKEYVGLLSSIVFKDVMNHFSRQEGPKDKWDKWSEAYTKHMAKVKKSSNRILQDSGRLRQSFVPSNFRTSKAGILWYNPAKTSNNFPYALAHDKGMGERPPKRQFMWASKKAITDIADQTLQFALSKE